MAYVVMAHSQILAAGTDVSTHEIWRSDCLAMSMKLVANGIAKAYLYHHKGIFIARHREGLFVASRRPIYNTASRRPIYDTA